MPRIVITVPTYNEEVVIGQTLQALSSALGQSFPSDNVLIEVADNGSTDRTVEIVENFKAKNQTIPIGLLQVAERGKGIAIRRSWERHLPDADVLVFTDADLAADIRALPALVAPILEREADLVCGSRFAAGSSVKRRFSREVVSRLFRVAQQAILRLPVQDAQCGFKAISATAAKEILPLCREDSWLFDSELLAFAAQAHLRIREIPVSWIEDRDPRRHSALHVFRDGWKFLLELAKIKKRVLRST